MRRHGCCAGLGWAQKAANASMPPLQTAIIDAVIDGMPCYTQVRVA